MSYSGPSYWTFGLTSSATQDACFRVAWHRGRPPADGIGYDSRAAAVAAARTAFPLWFDDPLRRPGDHAPPCVAKPGEDGPEPPTPFELAVSAWHGEAMTLAPSIEVVPEAHDHSLVGIPTIIAIDDYGNARDTDTDARTITWDFGGFRVRATASHRVAWGDEHDRSDDDAAWRDSNGRGYVAGDERGAPYADPQPFAHVYQWAGTHEVTVEVRWTGEWANAGGPWEPLPVPPILQQVTEPIEVRELQPVITR